MTDPNDPAYPQFNDHPLAPEDAKGLSKREWLAGMAMNGLCSLGASNIYPAQQGKPQEWPKIVARRALEYADALIAELNKKP